MSSSHRSGTIRVPPTADSSGVHDVFMVRALVVARAVSHGFLQQRGSFHDTQDAIETKESHGDRFPSSFFSLSRTACEAPLTYDYIVIGGAGKTGSQAIQELKRHHAKVAVIDPRCKPRKHHFRGRVYGLDPYNQEVSFDDTTLKYNKAVLIVTGVRGAPIPSYLIQDDARDLVHRTRPWNDDDVAPIPEDSQETFAVMGSGWQALELALSKKRRRRKSHLIFGASNILPMTLPHYLATAVRKRCQKHCHIHEQTVVRYISKTPDAKVSVHTARANDLMSSSSILADRVIVAPSTSGSAGSAALASWEHIPDSLQEKQPWFHTWSNAGEASPVLCSNDDGRIVVNMSLQACQGVYAAGSAAQVPNPVLGCTTPGSGGGVTAARSMLGLPSRYDPLQAWNSSKVGPHLGKVGIQATTVGICNAELGFTHGIWWTNQAAQVRMMRMVEEQEDSESGQSSLLKRRKSHKKMSAQLPVYGLGVIYYLDSSRRLQGIMCWGLPTTSAAQQHMRRLIQTNAGFYSVDTDQDHMAFSRTLEQQARQLVALSFLHEEAQDDHLYTLRSDRIHWKDFPRPLHRFTDPKSSRPWSSLRRKRGAVYDATDVLLYQETSESSNELTSIPFKDLIRSPEITHNTPLVGGALAATERAKEETNWALWEQKERLWDENEDRGRPPKEDLLWIRRGDEMKSVTASQSLFQAYGSVLWK